MNRLILSRMVLLNISDQEMAAALCMCLKTFRRRLKQPGNFTVNELRRAAKKLKMPITELFAS